MARSLRRENEPWDDPIVAEVRRVRGELLAAAGFDLEEFCKRLRDEQQREGRAVVTRQPRTPERQIVKTARARQTKRTHPTASKKRRG